MLYHNSYHLFIYNVFFPYKYPYFLYLDYIYFLAVLSAAPSGYIFFVFYIRKRSYAAMFVCKS